MTPQTVLWTYIVLLVAGGLAGFLKARSRASLIASLILAALLSLCALGFLRPYWIADAILVFLLLFFGLRFGKSRKLMPAGLMTLLSIVALALRNIRF